MLHQHAEPGHQLDKVTLRLDTADSDGDGLPDDWEMHWFGDLSRRQIRIPDQDGVSNSEGSPLLARIRQKYGFESRT